MPVTSVNLAITAVGLLTSVGHDALTACASIRAGLSRPSPIEEHKVLDLPTGEMRALTAHPVTPFTDGFVSTARWLQMAPHALDDLRAVGQLPPGNDAAFWGCCALMIVLPDLDGDRFVFDQRASPMMIRSTFIAPMQAHLPQALPPTHVLLQPLDRIALPRIVERASELMRQMRIERIVVLAVDSYVDPFALDWLGEAGRLKNDLNPVGLMPGECAAALLLEADRRGVHDSRPSWATVTTVAVSRDASLGGDGISKRGRGLGEVLAPIVAGDAIDLYSDINGETWRSRELGNALVQLGEPAPRVHHAASEVGDVGAASSVLNTILAARSLQRGYARANRVAIAISSESGDVGALALQRT